nr:9069_t:CDS:2 [Entrophospora candida]
MSLDERDSSNEYKPKRLLEKNDVDDYGILDGKHTPQNIALYSYLFGVATGGSIAIAYYSETIPQLGVFFATLSVFHILEYIITAMPYHIAHTAGVLEYSIELFFFPNLKTIRLFHYTGFALILIGQTARTLAMCHAKSNFTHSIQYVKRQEHTLVTTRIYRHMRYPDDIYFEHPQNVSVMTYRGHSVLRTLIRCHFGYFNFGGCRIFSRNLNWRMNFGGKLHDYLRLAPQENVFATL